MTKITKVSDQIKETVERLDAMGVLNEATVLLFGSHARNVGTTRSDIDIMVITPIQIRRWRVPLETHLNLVTRDRFIRRLKRGDDFPAWTFRFGRVIHDPSGWWSELRSDARLSKIWPDWKRKIEQAKRRLRRAEQILKIGDHGAAEEQLLLATVLASRAYLLKEGIFPLSRPELPDQLRRRSAKVLAELLEMLGGDGIMNSAVAGRYHKMLGRVLKTLRDEGNKVHSIDRAIRA